MFYLSKRCYKVFALIGENRKFMYQHLTVLDTGACPNFIRADKIPPGSSATIQGRQGPSAADANGRPLTITGIISLLARIGQRLQTVNFFGCERLAATVILGCDFNDKHVEAIYPRWLEIELVDGTTVPIVRKLFQDRPMRRRCRRSRSTQKMYHTLAPSCGWSSPSRFLQDRKPGRGNLPEERAVHFGTLSRSARSTSTIHPEWGCPSYGR